MPKINATVVLAKCSKNKKLFGMRVEERGKNWVSTWAFPIDESRAKNEGYAANKVSIGDADSAYPGCPHCKDDSFVKCGTCGKISCAGGVNQETNLLKHVCPWCGAASYVEHVDSIDASGGGF